jgi:hypothetical protein
VPVVGNCGCREISDLLRRRSVACATSEALSSVHVFCDALSCLEARMKSVEVSTLRLLLPRVEMLRHQSMNSRLAGPPPEEPMRRCNKLKTKRLGFFSFPLVVVSAVGNMPRGRESMMTMMAVGGGGKHTNVSVDNRRPLSVDTGWVREGSIPTSPLTIIAQSVSILGG